MMLRKTGVRNANQVYDGFISRYPTLESLGAADEAEVRGMISALGIADRARLMVLTAQRLTADFSGRIPDSVDKLMSLPGVGRYTANAVLCFAYRKPTALVDTNVIRVLNRVFSIKSGHARPRMDPAIWRSAQRLVSETRPVAYNRALLDFAGTVCTARAPLCDECPLTEVCDFYRSNRGAGSSRR